MIDFFFQSPTALHFGKDKEKEIGSIISSYSFKRIMIVIGGGSVKKSGLLDRVISSLDENNISYLLVEGVRANPTIQFVLSALEEVKDYKPELILAIGGGSVIDTAKLIASGYYYDGNPFDFNLHKAKPTKALPIGVILTISAAGSEMSTSAVIQDDVSGIKSGFNSELNRPLFAIENPELTYTVSKEQTGYGIVDIMMHTLERYFQKSSSNELADEFALGLLTSVVKAGRAVTINPCDYEARATLMLASSLSHNGLTSIGKPFMMPVHQLEHGLSGLYPSVAHGAGLAILFPVWARLYVDYDLDKFDILAKRVFDSYLKDKKENAINGIKKMEEFFDSLGMPLSFEELDVEVDVDKLVSIVSNNGTRVIPHHTKPIDDKIMKEIFTLALRRR